MAHPVACVNQVADLGVESTEGMDAGKAGRGETMRRPTIAGTLVACGLLIGLAVPVASLAQPPGPRDGPRHRWGHHRGPEPDRFIARHAEELGLSAETLDAIEKIVDESRVQSEAIREKLRGEYEVLHGYLTQEMPDESAVMAQAEAIEALKLAAHKNRLRAMIAIRNQLTPEQRQELVRIRDERMPRGRKRGPMSACRDDLARLCPEAEPGQSTLQCLSSRWGDLSDACRGAFEGGPRGGFGRWDRSPPASE
jgi:Spy/CpxP family protein refolding chaperone